MEEFNRSLRRVVERFPVPIYLAQHYSSFYIREKLECGHAITIYPQGDPLIAKWRTCPQCAASEFPAGASSPKKPAQPERAAPGRSIKIA